MQCTWQKWFEGKRSKAYEVVRAYFDLQHTDERIKFWDQYNRSFGEKNRLLASLEEKKPSAKDLNESILFCILAVSSQKWIIPSDEGGNIVAGSIVHVAPSKKRKRGKRKAQQVIRIDLKEPSLKNLPKMRERMAVFSFS